MGQKWDKVDLGREFSTKENKFLLNLEQKPNDGNTTSKERKLLDDPKLASLREFMDASVASYFKEIYSPNNEVNLRITQSWVNYTKPGQWHHKHAQGNPMFARRLHPLCRNSPYRVCQVNL